MNLRNLAGSPAVSRFRPLMRSAVLAALFLVAIAGCDEDRGTRVGDRAPGFSDLDIAGRPVSVDALQGKKVLLCFWSATCCAEFIGRLEPLYRKGKAGGLEIVAVNVGDPPERVSSYAAANSLTFAVVSDQRRLIAKTYGVFGYPTMFILDRKGVITEKVMGDVGIARIETLVGTVP